MTEQRTCDFCKLSVRAIHELGLCFACDMFQTFATVIQKEAGLCDEEALDLASDLQDRARSALIERLQLPGQGHPLATELLQTMEQREKSH
jgi:hypothetical protein